MAEKKRNAKIIKIDVLWPDIMVDPAEIEL